MLRLLAVAVAAFGLAAVGLVAVSPASGCCIRVQLLPRHPKSDPPPLAIGDSVMIAAARTLARRGFEVDAREGRFMRSALRILKTRRRRDTRPSVVVVALGTNFPPTYREIRRSLRLLGPRRTLALVTPLRSWRPLPAPAIWRAARNHPRRVRVLDWAGLSVRHPEWLWGDGTHLRPGGARAYARLLHCAIAVRVNPGPACSWTRPKRRVAPRRDRGSLR
jgi:hypothetical protein